MCSFSHACGPCTSVCTVSACVHVSLFVASTWRSVHLEADGAVTRVPSERHRVSVLLIRPVWPDAHSDQRQMLRRFYPCVPYIYIFFNLDTRLSDSHMESCGGHREVQPHLVSEEHKGGDKSAPREPLVGKKAKELSLTVSELCHNVC